MKLELPKRPQLRGAGDLQAPKMVTDLVHDLRTRRLLPLVALLLVAIVAAPFVLSSPGPELTPTSGETGVALTPGSGQPELTVVAQTPVGLRDYRTRLRRLTAKNPFRAHFTTPQVAGANLGTAGATTTVPTSVPSATTVTSTSPDPAPSPNLPPPSSSVTVTSPPGPSSGSAAGGSAGTGDLGGGGDHGAGAGGTQDSGGGGHSTHVQVQTQLVSYRIDASVGAPGKTKVRRNLPELTMLPNPKNPVAIFMGVSPDAKRALFLVSTEVTSVFGDIRCGFGDATCQLIELEPGFPVMFTYGAENKHFKIAVQKITRTASTQRDPGGFGKRPLASGLGPQQAP